MCLMLVLLLFVKNEWSRDCGWGQFCSFHLSLMWNKPKGGRLPEGGGLASVLFQPCSSSSSSRSLTTTTTKSLDLGHLATGANHTHTAAPVRIDPSIAAATGFSVLSKFTWSVGGIQHLRKTLYWPKTSQRFKVPLLPTTNSVLFLLSSSSSWQQGLAVQIATTTASGDDVRELGKPCQGLWFCLPSGNAAERGSAKCFVEKQFFFFFFLQCSTLANYQDILFHFLFQHIAFFLPFRARVLREFRRT